jgi:recombination protein RecT
MQDLQRAQQQGNASKALTTFPIMLKKLTGEIGHALPKHMNADRMTRIALTEFRKNPNLGKCDPKSICASIVIASQLGLEPGVLGQGYLVPYKETCQFIPGWQGFADLVSRTGRASVWTGAVFKGDEFEYALGDSPFLKHKPGDSDQDLKDLLCVYAIGRIKDAQWPVIEVWSVNKVKKHRDRYNKQGDKHYSFAHFEMYARKVVLLQVIKYMPKSVELAMASDLDNAASTTGQNISLDDALSGDYVDVTEPIQPDEPNRPEAKQAKQEPVQEVTTKEVVQERQDTEIPPDKKKPDSSPPPSDLFTSFRDEMKECTSTAELVPIKKNIEVRLRDSDDERELLLDHLARRMVELNKKEAGSQPEQPARRPRNIE